MLKSENSDRNSHTRREFGALLAAGAGLAVLGERTEAAPAERAQQSAEPTVSSLVEIKEFSFPQGKALAMKINGADDETLGYVVRCPKGALVCMNFDVKFMASKGKTVAQIWAIPGFDRILDAVVKEVPEAAAKLGVRPAMTAKEAVLKLM
ncbi:MAG: hypothetical protein COZ06_29240 [Armatimonadetes bacterium CG_4_10_14_3_um_filter_66_18]|nr:hypothetical protein [Armatimonadota bacterium]OIO98537.1 MAG: hypothetical protein AUJ96_20935 [Armatimonadetes bacterium CG2_30_66_41]PIU89302.1 MAG: hypothetical protein COS65_28845 [Armatimonadetes bacterium CG06_land_8_20_14_3_00_66_21]PIX41289.1 MAG: hypothetical protein COZ57_23745 [Armatimonadetes bacterium CG_4_8_14_3_um_filter_66_20]PIY39683.1 MAG: hypothetical protein COZ06_29240 [Armatimonadetes bacterium CG_4_10_14_3_um_filter_66_18]PIZ45137.1 MAG: hypothetical protein COY42_12